MVINSEPIHHSMSDSIFRVAIRANGGVVSSTEEKSKKTQSAKVKPFGLNDFVDMIFATYFLILYIYIYIYSWLQREQIH